MSEPVILLGNNPDDYVPCQHVIPLAKPTLILTEEEYYQAMREYEQWRDEQALSNIFDPTKTYIATPRPFQPKQPSVACATDGETE